MPRNWRCSHGHTWTGDMGALLACPQCHSTDVYEYRVPGQTDTAQRPRPGSEAAFAPTSTDVYPLAAPAKSPLDSTAIQMPALADPVAKPAAPPKPKRPIPPPPPKRPPPPPPSPGRFKDTDVFPAVRLPKSGDTFALPPSNPAEQSTADLPALPAGTGDTVQFDAPTAADSGGTVMLDGTPAPAASSDRTVVIDSPSTADWTEETNADYATGSWSEPADDGGTVVVEPDFRDSTCEFTALVDTAADPGSTGDFTAIVESDNGTTGDFTAVIEGDNGCADDLTAVVDFAGASTTPDTEVVSPESAVKLGQRGGRTGPAFDDTVSRVAQPRAKAKADGKHRPPEVEGYDILGVLGRGGMGVVYKARQKGLQRLVALKMILGGAHAGEADKGRFRLEAEAVAQMQHRNIVAIYDVGENDGLPFFSLEYLDGGSLQERANGQPMPPRVVADIVAQIADAMQYAHERGIVHRDLKPANVLFQKAPEGSRTSVHSTGDFRPSGDIPKITDFGLAKKIEGDSGFTGTGAILGTPSFMSPEQADGRTKEIGPPTDIHALGAILYDLLTGRPPFLGADPMDTIIQVRNLDPVPPTRWNPRTPLDLENIVLKCLQKDMAKRYASAGALADDLRRFLAGEPVLAHPTPAWEKAYKWAKRRPTAAAVVGLSTLLALSLLVGSVALARSKQMYAESQRLRADEQEQTAVKETRLREVAEHQRGRAEGNLKKMRYALDELLTRVGDRQLRDVPAVTKIRGQLLDQAAAIYDEAVKTEADPNLTREAGWAQQRAGRLREALGEPKDAADAYRKAAALFEKVVAKHNEPDDRKNLADTHRLLATVSASMGQAADADKSFETAQDLLGGLTQEFPKDDIHRLELAALLNSRGTVHGDRRQAAEAEAAFRKALEIVGTMSSSDAGLEAAKARLNLGLMLVATSRADSAIAELRAGRERLAGLIGLYPDDQRHAAELARAANLGGIALWQAGRYDAAEESLAAAVKQFGELSAKFPSNLDYRFEYAKQRQNLAKLLGDLGKPTATAERAAARELFRELADKKPSNLDYRTFFGKALVDRSAELETAGQRADAIAAAAEGADVLTKVAVVDPNDALAMVYLARAKANLGKLYLRDAQTAKAEPPIDEAIALYQTGQKRIGSPDLLRDLAGVYADQATTKKLLNKPALATTAMTGALFTLDRYSAQTPALPDGPAEIGRLSAQLAQEAAAQPNIALRNWRKAVTSQREAYKRFLAQKSLTGWIDYETYYGQYGTSLIDALVGEGDAAGAAKAVAELADMPAKWRGWTDVAALLGKAASRAEGDAKAACCKESLACLQRAAAGGTLDAAKLRESPDFAALRDAAEYKAEVEKFAAAPVEPKPK